MSDLVVGDFHGYRAWYVDTDGRLRALSAGSTWTSTTKTATCKAGLLRVTDAGHVAPVAGCTCGLYAYYRAGTVTEATGTVFGVVSVAGRVILATRGMKAERMTILALVTDDEALGRRYGVPIYPSRQALLSDYPSQDYSELVDVDPTDPVDWASVTLTLKVDLTAFGVAMEQAAQSMKAAMYGTALTAAQIASQFSVTDVTTARVDPADVKARALELRKHRNTGPETDPFRWDRRRR